ncbi:MAG: Xylose isomerase domain protein barrel, partial [Thermomicrobiales bacterium]|nr:Xylose isomerase domain protein barrel [Thermomicrobiales bacterium]
MKVSIREGMVRGESLAEKLAWLESVGLDAVELHAGTLLLPAAEIEEAFTASPISVSAIEGIPRLLSADPAEREAAKQTIRERIDLAGALGAVGERIDLAGALGAVGVLVVPQFGRIPALPDLVPLATGAELERNLLLAQLRELAPAAKAAGVSLFLEPLNRYEAYIVNRLEQGTAIAAEVGPGIGVMADFFHMGIEEVDIAASIRANRQHLVYVHV